MNKRFDFLDLDTGDSKTKCSNSLLRTIVTRDKMLTPPRKRARNHVTAYYSPRASSERSTLDEDEQRVVTNLIEYIDLYEVPSRLRI